MLSRWYGLKRCKPVRMSRDEAVSQTELSLTIVFVHVDARYQKGRPGNCAVEDLMIRIIIYRDDDCGDDSDGIFFVQTSRDCSNLVCEKSILAGEREALNNSTSEVLQCLGGEATVKRLVAAVQLGVGLLQQGRPELCRVC